MVFYSHLIFCEAALLARPETEALAGPVTQHLAGFAALHEAELAWMRREQQVMAQVRIGDQLLDEALVKLQRAVLAEVEQDKRRPAYQALFKDSLSELIKYGIDQQTRIAQEALTLLESKDGPYSASLVKAHAPKLKAAIKGAAETIATRDALAVEGANLARRAQAWKQDANAVFMAVEGELLKIAASMGHKRVWARAFFAGR